ncbi:MAG TPA: S41 family peptidase [Bacteroidales bacterium]|nr:S41 family peptidase [Bacteroidales bacterium]
MKTSSPRYIIYFPLIIALSLIAGIYLGSRLIRVSLVNQRPISILQPARYHKVNDVIQYILQDYVDPVQKDLLEKEAITGMLKNLDPHSQFISAEEFADVNDPLLGAFEGIGIQFRMERDTCTVIQTIVGGPSERAGLLAGDRIVMVDDSLVAGVNMRDRDMVRMLKGEKGSKVKVSVYRRGVAGLIDLTIIRDVIPTYSIDIAYMVNDSVGYIKLSKFAVTTHQELLTALKKLKEKGMQKLLFDLRGNSGGYLQTAIRVADEFLEQGQLIVYTEGHNRPRQEAYSTGKGTFKNNPLVILIDEGSASASEIIAGAIQDNDRGLVVGRRSFGKGLVQEQLNLNDGSAIRLTVARYFTPTGRSIQKPYDNGAEDYYHDFYNRIISGELDDPESVEFDDSLKFITPGGRVVYGGGGIMPDIYVTIERDQTLNYYTTVANQGLIYQFAFDFTDAQRTNLGRFSHIDEFIDGFNISDAVFSDFISFAEDQGVKSDGAAISRSKDRIKHLLKAFIARNIFDDEGFYPIYLQTDKAFLEAQEVLNSWIVGEPVPLIPATLAIQQ